MSSEPVVFADPAATPCQPITLVGGLDHSATYRTRPDPDRPVEVAVVAAAAEARADSLARLETWFGGFRFDLLQQNVDANVASVLQVDPVALADLAGPALVDRVLGWHDLPSPRLTFAGGGNQRHVGAPEGAVEPSTTPFSITRVRPAAMALRIREGNTAIVNQIDQYDDRLGDLSEHLERVAGTRSSTNCYLSYGVAEGFGAHWDDHDVLILQLVGSKFWELRGPDVLSPMNGYAPSEVNGDVVWSGVLRPGTALFIPRGWGHRVNGFDELSIHLTIGLRRMNGQDVLTHIATEALKQPAFRADLPFGATETDLGDALGALATDADVDAAVGFWRAQIRTRTQGGFLAIAGALGDPAGLDDMWIRAPLPGGIVFATEATSAAGDSDDLGLGLAVGGVRVRLSAEAAPALVHLADGRPHRVGDLPFDCHHPGPACRDRLVRGLLEAGITDVVDRP